MTNLETAYDIMCDMFQANYARGNDSLRNMYLAEFRRMHATPEAIVRVSSDLARNRTPNGFLPPISDLSHSVHKNSSFPALPVSDGSYLRPTDVISLFRWEKDKSTKSMHMTDEVEFRGTVRECLRHITSKIAGIVKPMRETGEEG